MKHSDGLNFPCSRKAVVQDCLFLSLIVLISFILYIWGLGFYLDDYAFLKQFITSNNQSVIGLSQALYSGEVNTRMRPVGILFLAGQYWLFGPYPFAYHLVRASVLLSSVVLFYLVLREMGQLRLFTLTVPLVYALLPHYSSDRFLFVNFPHAWSIALYFLSLYADLRALRNRLAHLWRWKLLSGLSLLGSGLTYEVALPLFLLNPLLVLYRAQQLYGWVLGRQLIRRNGGLLLASNFLLLGLVVAYKWLIMISLINQTSLMVGIRYKSSYVHHLVALAAGAIGANYFTYGLGLPYVVWRALDISPDWTIIIVSGLLGLIIFGYLSYVANQTETTLPSKASWLACIAVGLVVFGSGYATFLTTDRIVFNSANIENRVAIAAAIGVALSFVGGVGWVSALLPSHLFRKTAFCLLVTLLCMSGFLINSTVAAFWISAYRQQQAILADIRGRIPTLSAGSTLVLDGVCPEIGPAIVFKSHYDLAGALIIAYRDPTLRADHNLLADVVTSNLQIEEKGISIRGQLYPYSQKLLLYNFTQKSIHQLIDAETADRYSKTINSDLGCPTGSWDWIDRRVIARFCRELLEKLLFR